MKFVVRFRYIPPKYSTPEMHLPIEQAVVEAESLESAWITFLIAEIPVEKRDWYRLEEVYEINTDPDS